MSAIDKFLSVRNKYKSEMDAGNALGKGQGHFKGSNEFDLCGDKNLGSTMGVFISDVNEAPYRVIKGVRTIRINKEIADQYGIKDFRLRIADPDEYLIPEADKEIIRKLNKKVEAVEQNWDAWEGKICKFRPTYNDLLTIQYMKVLQKLDVHNNPVQMDPGVKVIMSRSKAYFRAFDGFISNNEAATGGYEFIDDLLSRTPKTRNTKYVIKVTRAQYYNFVITPVTAPTEITEEDIRIAGDLNTEVVDVTKINKEELAKWNKMFNEEYLKIKNGVEKGSVPPQPAPEPTPMPEPEPAPAPQPVVEEEVETDPFA